MSAITALRQSRCLTAAQTAARSSSMSEPLSGQPQRKRFKTCSGQASACIISTSFCSHNFLRIIPISFLICPYIAILRYFGANTGISMLCAANLQYLFPFEKTSWYFIGAVGRPHLHYTRRPFHYIIFFTLPSIAGGRYAKADHNKKSRVFKLQRRRRTHGSLFFITENRHTHFSEALDAYIMLLVLIASFART